MSHVCSQCQPVKLYGSSDALRRHRRTHHSGTKPSWQCPQCNKKPFSRQDHLTRHIKEKHTGEHLGECELCLRTFSNRYLKEHKETCKSRSFGQANEPPLKKVCVAELPGEQLTFGSLPPQAAGENAAKVPEQAPRLKFVRGYVAPVSRRKKVISSDSHEVVAAPDFSIQKQGVVGTHLEPLKLNSEQKREIDQAIRDDNIALFTEIIGTYGVSQDTLLAVNEAYSYLGNRLLHTAAYEGSVNVARLLLSAGIDTNSVNRDHEMPLHIAVASLKIEMVKLLFQRGADVNARDRDGWTALFSLCSSYFAKLQENKALEIANLLLERGASIDAEDKRNGTALFVVSSRGMNLVVKRLLQAGASVNGSSKEGSSTPLMGACYFAAPDIVLTLLEHGADVNRCHSRSGPPNGPDAYEKEFFVLEADINLGQIQSRWTALAYACNPYNNAEESEELSTRLLAAGADPNLGDVVPLETAIIYGYPSVIKILLDAGADPSLVSDVCIETLQGLRRPEYPYQCKKRKEKWVLLLQYFPVMFGDRRYFDSAIEG